MAPVIEWFQAAPTLAKWVVAAGMIASGSVGGFVATASGVADLRAEIEAVSADVDLLSRRMCVVILAVDSVRSNDLSERLACAGVGGD